MRRKKPRRKPAGETRTSPEKRQHFRGRWLCFEPLESRRVMAGNLQLLKDIYTPGINPGGSTPSDIVEVSGVAYFSAYTPTYGNELWKSDGTAAGTTMVKDLYVGINDSN